MAPSIQLTVKCPRCKNALSIRLQNVTDDMKGNCPHCKTTLHVNMKIEVSEKDLTRTSIGMANLWKRNFGTAKSHFG